MKNEIKIHMVGDTNCDNRRIKAEGIIKERFSKVENISIVINSSTNVSNLSNEAQIVFRYIDEADIVIGVMNDIGGFEGQQYLFIQYAIKIKKPVLYITPWYEITCLAYPGMPEVTLGG